VNPRENYIKRIVGVPGDRIRIVNKQLYLNGKAVREPYVVHKTPYIDSYRDNFPSEPNTRLAEPAYDMLANHVVNGEVVVPPGCYFAMGDNRDNSLDSRYWGFVPRENIIGKPAIIFWSYETSTERLADPNIISIDHLIDLGLNFFTKTRWKRTLMVPRSYPLG
jgi:signal peptidase I